jgi:rhodanese-related sulfurtransferase
MMSKPIIKSIGPIEANAILDQDPSAQLIDVRSKVEFDYVGHPLGALHVPWKEFPGWDENLDFAAAVATKLAERGDASEDRALLMLCRSGVRSLAAGEVLVRAGHIRVYNIEGGFEGERDAAQHRGNINGWRFDGLPWEQG